MADFVQGTYTTSLTTGEIILGFDMPDSGGPLRWGFAKVVRKSGAFANSIAFVVMPVTGEASVVLAAAGARPYTFGAVARQIADGVNRKRITGCYRG